MLQGLEPQEHSYGNVKCAVLVVGVGLPTYSEARRVILVSIESADEGLDLLENWKMMDLEDDDRWDGKALRGLAAGLHRVHAHFWFSKVTGMDFTEFDCGVRVAEVVPVAA